MKLEIPDFSMVALVGITGSGKSTFAANHFLPTEVISSDRCRAWVSDDETDQGATADAFDLVYFMAAKRLARRRLTVIDATNIHPPDRKQLVRLARDHHALPVAIVFHTPAEICRLRNETRTDRPMGARVVKRQHDAFRRGLKSLKLEGFRYVFHLDQPETATAASVVRQPLWTDRRDQTGPFDIIGDLHGCADELEALLGRLGYTVSWETDTEGACSCRVAPPPGRRVIFVGDLVDRGPRIADTLRIAMTMVEAGQALCVIGNHEYKLLRWLRGADVRIAQGLQATIDQLTAESAAFRERVKSFLDGLVSHYWLDGGRLAVAHAGIKAEMMGRASGAIRSFCMFGEVTGERDAYGLPVRLDWARDYRGDTTVVYGHTPVARPDWLNNTVNIDTGCVFGGHLTALRYPERELVSVPAAQTYSEPSKPLGPAPIGPRAVQPGEAEENGESQDTARGGQDDGRSAQHRHDDLLDVTDVIGKRFIETRLRGRITIQEANTAAALEVMGRYALDPKWLIYLPPTMSPPHTSERPGLLEHPDEAFAAFRQQGIETVVCEEKHMGSRALLVVTKEDVVAVRRFGLLEPRPGVIYTRTGRPFLDDAAWEREVLHRLRAAMTRAGVWETLQTDWVLLDAELMPWSVRAMGLIRRQYAATGAAGRIGLALAEDALVAAAARGVVVDGLAQVFAGRRGRMDAYGEAYRRYCWPVAGVDDLRLAPFHLLASEGAVHFEKDHVWHMETLGALADQGDDLIQRTAYRVVPLESAETVEAVVAWWESLTAVGGEGMVVKPLGHTVRGERGLVQPGIKVRGPSYLRIIYGADYDAPEHLDRLRQRGISHKASMAIREFALGHEALHRFVARDPLRRVHECVFGILALESEPVDPRL